MRRAAWLLLVLLVPSAVYSQSLTPEPPGPYVIDIRGTTLGVPQTSDFYPPDLPGDTIIPARGFGLQAGAHWYPWPAGPGRLGVGIDWSWVRGTTTSTASASTASSTTASSSTASSSTASSSTATTTVTDVRVTLRVLSPQVSINFGSSKGWSYLTAGGGVASVHSVAGSQDLSRTQGDINVGAGARWFITDHVGVGFDLRGHWIGGTKLFGAAAGFSLK